MTKDQMVSQEAMAEIEAAITEAMERAGGDLIAEWLQDESPVTTAMAWDVYRVMEAVRRADLAEPR